MGMVTYKEALDFLNLVSGKPLRYAIKSPDMELYDFGFGELIEVINRQGRKKRIGTHILHAICRFKVIWQTGDGRVDKYCEDTPSEEFHAEINRLLGLTVKRVALSDKNDLWLDLGECWIVFATYENGDESWRFFTSDTNMPHLVVANSWVDIQVKK